MYSSSTSLSYLLASTTSQASDNQDTKHHPRPTQSVSVRTPNPSTWGLPGARTRLLFLLLQPPLYPLALAHGGSYSQPPRLHLGLGEESGGLGGPRRPERPPAWEGRSLSLVVPPSLAQGRQGQRGCWL